MFDFLKKRDEGVPDIGKEEELKPVEDLGDLGSLPEDKFKEESDEDLFEGGSEPNPDEEDIIDEANPELVEFILEARKRGFDDNKIRTSLLKQGWPQSAVKNALLASKKPKGKKIRIKEEGGSSMASNFEIERLRAKIEANSEIVKGYSDRMSQLSQQIGEVRAMSMNNEKEIVSAFSKSAKAVDIVREVKPEELRIEYQKAKMYVDQLNEKIEMNKQFLDTIMNEIKDLRNKAGIFVGTDALLKLNEDVQKDLIEVQKVASRVRLNADKSEEIFIELKRGLADFQKTNAITANLDLAYSGLSKELEKLKVDYTTIIKQQELEDFKKGLNNRIISVERSISETESLKTEYEKLSQLVETLVSLSRNNKNDIDRISAVLGSEKIEKVVEYEKQFEGILGVIDALATQINELKKKINMPHERNFVKPSYNIQKVHRASVIRASRLKQILPKVDKEQTRKNNQDIQKLVQHVQKSRIRVKMKKK